MTDRKIPVGTAKKMRPITRVLVVHSVTTNKVRYADPDDASFSFYLRKDECGFPNHPDQIRVMAEGV